MIERRKYRIEVSMGDHQIYMGVTEPMDEDRHKRLTAFITTAMTDGRAFSLNLSDGGSIVLRSSTYDNVLLRPIK